MNNEKKKLIEDMKKYFETGEKLHIVDPRDGIEKTYVLYEDIMWVLDAALNEK